MAEGLGFQASLSQPFFQRDLERRMHGLLNRFTDCCSILSRFSHGQFNANEGHRFVSYRAIASCEGGSVKYTRSPVSIAKLPPPRFQLPQRSRFVPRTPVDVRSAATLIAAFSCDIELWYLIRDGSR
jgi:hypothetical protein